MTSSNAGYSGLGVVTPGPGEVAEVYAAKNAEGLLPGTTTQSTTFSDITVNDNSAFQGATTVGTTTAPSSLVVNGSMTSTGDVKASQLSITSSESTGTPLRTQGYITGVGMLNRKFTRLTGDILSDANITPGGGTPLTWTTTETDVGVLVNPGPSQVLTLGSGITGEIQIRAPDLVANFGTYKLDARVLSYSGTTGTPVLYLHTVTPGGDFVFSIKNVGVGALNGSLDLSFEVLTV